MTSGDTPYEVRWVEGGSMTPAEAGRIIAVSLTIGPWDTLDSYCARFDRMLDGRNEMAICAVVFRTLRGEEPRFSKRWAPQVELFRDVVTEVEAALESADAALRAICATVRR